MSGLDPRPSWPPSAFLGMSLFLKPSPCPQTAHLHPQGWLSATPPFPHSTQGTPGVHAPSSVRSALSAPPSASPLAFLPLTAPVQLPNIFTPRNPLPPELPLPRGPHRAWHVVMTSPGVTHPPGGPPSTLDAQALLVTPGPSALNPHSEQRRPTPWPLSAGWGHVLVPSGQWPGQRWM